MSFITSSCYLALMISCVTALIIPEELPSILSVIYSNIPPVMTGTDSRVGLGFRLGEHADFQVLLELGPQTRTQPIGSDAESKRRRQVQRPPLVVQPTKGTYKVSDTPGGKWISSWRSGFMNPKFTKNSAAESQQIIVNPMEGKDHIMSHLQQLYKQTEESNGRSNSDGAAISDTRTVKTESSTLTVQPSTTTTASSTAEVITSTESETTVSS